MTTILDTCALVMVGIGGASAWQARLTFALARHAIVDIAQIFRTAPTTRHASKDRLSHTDFDRIFSIVRPDQGWTEDLIDAERRLTEMREMYEPYVAALQNSWSCPCRHGFCLKTRSTIGRRALGVEFSEQIRNSHD